MVWPFNPSNTDSPQSHYSYSSSSTSRACKTDPQDQKYMLCKEITRNGNQVTQKQERIPIRERHNQQRTVFEHDFQKFGQDFEQMKQHADEWGQHLERDLSSMVSTLFMPFSLIDNLRHSPQFNNGQQSHNSNKYDNNNNNNGYKQNQQRSNQNYRKHYFTANQQKSFNVHDL